MAGAAPVETGKGGKRPLDVEFNLVPFIDLLSVLISFLLVVAVWTQISAMEVKHAPTQGGEKRKDKQISLNITLTSKAIYIGSSEGGQFATLEKKGEEYDWQGLTDKLKELKTSIPTLENVTIQAEDKIDYGHMIQTMDVCRGLGLAGLSLAGVPKST
jgi:biopolymer transport protein ExbD